jgi:hypothetical protein
LRLDPHLQPVEGSGPAGQHEEISETQKQPRRADAGEVDAGWEVMHGFRIQEGA